MNVKPRRSVGDLRTMSGRTSEAEKPQRRYIQLAILELQRVRHSREKERACQRVAEIDGRLLDIAHEQARLLGEAPAGTAHPPLGPQASFVLDY